MCVCVCLCACVRACVHACEREREKGGGGVGSSGGGYKEDGVNNVQLSVFFSSFSLIIVDIFLNAFCSGN